MDATTVWQLFHFCLLNTFYPTSFFLLFLHRGWRSESGESERGREGITADLHRPRAHGHVGELQLLGHDPGAYV